VLYLATETKEKQKYHMLYLVTDIKEKQKYHMFYLVTETQEKQTFYLATESKGVEYHIISMFRILFCISLIIF